MLLSLLISFSPYSLTVELEHRQVVNTTKRASVFIIPVVSLLLSVQSYKAAVGSALQAAQDVLGSLGLEPGPPGVEQSVQEVEVNCYDSDSLSSPPASSGEESEGEIDPLLDFSQEDEFTHRPGKPMIYNVLKTQQALGGLKAITHDIQEAKQRKAAVEEKQRAKILVAAEASFTPTFKGGMSAQSRAMPEQKTELEKPLTSVTTQRQSNTGNASHAPVQVSRIQPRAQPDTQAEHPRMEPRAKPEVNIPHNPQPLPRMVPNRTEDQQLRDITTQQRNKTSPPPAEVLRREPSPSEDLPPPVPPYNPHGPERHVWSNEPNERAQPGHVPLRRGRKKSEEDLPTTEMLGHVTDRANKRRSFSPPPVQPTLPDSGEWNAIFLLFSWKSQPRSHARLCSKAVGTILHSKAIESRLMRPHLWNTHYTCDVNHTCTPFNFRPCSRPCKQKTVTFSSPCTANTAGEW